MSERVFDAALWVFFAVVTLLFVVIFSWAIIRRDTPTGVITAIGAAGITVRGESQTWQARDYVVTGGAGVIGACANTHFSGLSGVLSVRIVPCKGE